MGIEGSASTVPLPGLSVVVTATPDDDPRAPVEWLTDRCTDPDLLEILLVHTGGPRALGGRHHPEGPTVRSLRVNHRHLGRARLLGLHSARREYVTFLAADDRIAEQALSAAIHLSRPDQLTALRAAPVPQTPAGAQRSPAPPGPPGATGPEQDPLLAAAAGSVRWILPTRLSIEAVPPVRPGPWWELLLAMRVLCASRAQVRWATGGSGDPEVASAGVAPTPRWDDVEPLLRALAALEDLAIADPGCSGVIATLVHRLALLHLRPLLLREPGLRVRMADEIVAARIRSFPYSAVTAGLATDLAIAYSFPPSQDTSAVVAAKRLRARGQVADVVSCDLHRGRDAGTTVIAGGFVDRQARTPGPGSYGQWPDVEVFMRSGLATVESWINEGRRYEGLYSRSMWPASHMLAAVLKHRYPGLTWSAEFSDPMQLTIQGRMRYDRIDEGSPSAQELIHALGSRGMPRPASDNLWEWAEHLPFALADEILFTNSQQRDLMLAGHGPGQLGDRARRRSAIGPHPQPPEAFYGYADPAYPLDPERLHVGYFGRFYANRGIGEALQAIRDSPRSVQESLHLHVFCDDPDSVHAHAREAGIRGFVTAQPYLPYFDFLAMARRIDLLIVTDTQTAATHSANPYLPSKLSDYLGSDSDIWALCEPGSPLSEAPVRFRSTLGDPKAAREILRQVTATRPATP